MPDPSPICPWTGAAVGMTEHLLRRPGASWTESFGIRFVAGGLAGMTSALRVVGGQHFSSDVLAGAAVVENRLASGE